MIKRHIEDRTGLRVIAKRLRETTHSSISAFTVYNAVRKASTVNQTLPSGLYILHKILRSP